MRDNETSNAKEETKMRTRKDSQGRKWEYNDAEGCYSFGSHVIGCANNNGSKWSYWTSTDRHPEEFDTLKAAMDACFDG